MKTSELIQQGKYTNSEALSFDGNRTLAKFLGCRWEPASKSWLAQGAVIDSEIIDVINGFAVIETVKELENNMVETAEIYVISFEENYLAKNEKFRWNPSLKVWEKNRGIAPKTKEEIKEISFSDCSGYPEITNEQLEEVGIKTALYDFQLKAVAKMVTQKKLINASDLGNGKSAMGITATFLLMKELKLRNLVIICPASLKYNWKAEILKHTRYPEEKIFVCDSKNMDKVHEYRKGIIIINYDILEKFEETLMANVIDVDTAFICDEAHYIKNPDAKRTKSFRYLTSKAPVLFLLTGTPISKNASDIYTMADAVDAPIAQLPFSAFEKRYCFEKTITVPVKGRMKEVKQYHGIKNDKELRLALFPYMLRFEAKEVDLPDYLTQSHSIVLTNAQYKEINKAVQEILKESNDLDKALKASIGEADTNDIAFGSLKRLLADCKVKNTVEFVKTLMETNEEQQVVVYSDHVDSAKKLAEELKAGLITGSTGVEARNEIVTKFQAGELKVLVGTSAIATGLTLTASNILVVNDCSWNATTDMQLAKRIHRIGQEKRCIRYNIEMLPTFGIFDIDRHINKLLAEKIATMQKMQG